MRIRHKTPKCASKFPFGANDNDAPVVLNLLYPIVLHFRRFEAGFHRLVKQVAAFKVQRESIEVFLDARIEDAIILKEGEERGHLALVTYIRPDAPALPQIGGNIASQSPVEGVFDGAAVAFGNTSRLVVSDLGLGRNDRTLPTQRLLQADGTTVRRVNPMENLIQTPIDLLISPSLVYFVGHAGVGD